MPPSRRYYLFSIAAAFVAMNCAPDMVKTCLGAPKIYIDINTPAGKRLPIAVSDIKKLGDAGTQSEIGSSLRDIFISDLDFTGLFDVIDKKAYIETHDVAGKKADDVEFKNWRLIGAEALVTGIFAVGGDELTVEFKLFDVFQEKMLAGRRYIGKKADLRKIAHKFADDVMESLTGERGIFDTRFLFASNISGSKEIYMSDYDGYNTRQITRNGSINLSPQWSPDGRRILYTSYKEGQPYLYMMELSTGKETRLSNQPGINIGARWSPSGQEIVLTLSKDGNPELYVIELQGMKLKRLTNNWAIDVSPSWSPDGKRLAFVSDIGGNPHIYMIYSNGTGLARLTYDGKYNAAPAWSPRGDKIAFARLTEGRFDICIMNADGTGQIQLTANSGDNENPSWSPDGRYIAFTSTRNGTPGIYIMKNNGESQKRVNMENVKGGKTLPAWSPYPETK